MFTDSFLFSGVIVCISMGVHDVLEHLENVEDIRASTAFVAVVLSERDSATTAELTEILPFEFSTIYQALSRLRDRGMATAIEDPTGDARGRPELRYSFSRTREQTEREMTNGEMQVEIVKSLAARHWLEDRPALRAVDVAKDVGTSSRRVATAMRQLRDDGIVERVATKPGRYRLVGAENYVPMYADI